MARRKWRKRSSDPSEAAAPSDAAKLGRGAGGSVPATGSIRPKADPAEFKLSELARKRISRDVDLSKLLPILDKTQTRLLTLKDLNDEIHIEERTLRRNIERATQMRPHELLLRVFLRDVAHELKADKESLHDIASRFLIRVSTLSRAFKRIAGMTIREYRRRYLDASGEDSPR